jgi:hypothetical protein
MRLVLSVLLLSLVVVGFAQSPALPGVGVISGVVVDGSGGTVPGAIVQLLTGPRVVRSTTTDGAGVFRFDTVDAGSYQVRASSPLGAGTVSVTVTDVAGPPLRVVLVPPPAAPVRPEVRYGAQAAETSVRDERDRAMLTSAAPAPPAPAGMGVQYRGLLKDRRERLPPRRRRSALNLFD